MLDMDASLELTCLKCGIKFKKTIRELEINSVISCPNGHEIHVKGKELSEVKGTGNSLHKFKNYIRRMFK